jgi:uncharacterized protein (TIGR02271 family)
MPDSLIDKANRTSVSSEDVERQTIVPVYEEELAVSKKIVETARVQVSRVTHSHEQLVDELLNHEKVDIQRIPIDKPIDAMPSIREEGDVTIVPVVEEVLKVERYLLLKEEIHIRRIKETERHQERVLLRRQEATVSRLPITTEAASTPGAQPDAIHEKKENL